MRKNNASGLCKWGSEYGLDDDETCDGRDGIDALTVALLTVVDGAATETEDGCDEGVMNDAEGLLEGGNSAAIVVPSEEEDSMSAWECE